MPVYNTERKVLLEAIDSVRGQVYVTGSCALLTMDRIGTKPAKCWPLWPDPVDRSCSPRRIDRDIGRDQCGSRGRRW